MSRTPGPLRLRRFALAALALVALISTLAACGSSDDDSTSTAATPATTAATTAAAATPDLAGVELNVQVEDSGGWDLELKEAGLDDFPYKVNWVRLATGNLAVQALASGAVDVGRTSDIPPLFAPPGKTKTVGFQHTPIVDAPGGFEVLAPKGSDIKEPADLKGKTVGYTEATATQYALLKILEQGGLTWDDIKPVNLTLPDGLAALTGGKVDALSTLGQPALLAAEQGATRIGDYSTPFASGNTLVVTRPAAIDDPGKHAAIADLISRLVKATEWEQAHPEQWIKAQTDDQRTEYQSALDRYNATIKNGGVSWSAPTPEAIAAQQDVADAFFAAGALRAKVDVADQWVDAFPDAFAKPTA
jgi:sulfonate transport system substrate-binding protein